MTVSIEKDGWKITGGTLKDLEIGIEALQRTLQKPEGTDRPRGPGRPKTIDKDQKEREKLTVRRTVALKVLKAINAAGDDGVTAEGLNRLLDLSAPKALGSQMMMVNKMIQETGLDPDDVYSSFRLEKTRFWLRDEKINQAILAITNIENH